MSVLQRDVNDRHRSHQLSDHELINEVARLAAAESQSTAALIFDQAITLPLHALEKQKLAATNRPRTAKSAESCTRHVPAAVRRTVWARDEGRCKFEGAAGRCEETGFLEFHHVVPYASGGETTVDNLELRCTAHNRYEAEQYFGLFVREIRPAWNALAV